MIKQFEDSKLWKIFVQKSSLEIQGKVKVILDKTIPELKHIVRVFPTYTNHDNEHSLKILELIEMLLGDSVEHLSAPEVSVLLLSAFWHDLGMVCNDPNEIIKEIWFEEFIENKPTLDIKKLDNNIVSEYIRVNHHKRLEKYLYDTDNILDKSEKELLCDGFDIIKIAFEVSKSHNYETKDLSSLKELATNNQKDDFVLCAIMLRLADIMDFDNERTPESVYKLLELDNPKNGADEYSQKEWQKHIDSLGFDYINGKLFFKAAPKSPDVEHYIREFIKVIEHELEKCKIVFDSSCHKWKDQFTLPIEIDISGIKSRGYKFGDYKFSFDNHQALTLLAGNNIYANPMIFIRELLQNSIDASLYRQAIEREKGKTFQSDPINITNWYDKEGSYWIRFDDYGIGMDEYILLNYFTKIGKSFYESKDFNKQLGFTAISRFGIGILSCFMVADRIEVSTKKENNPAIRFSIKSMDSYFITQIEGEHPNIDAFPSEKEVTEKYRRNPGTSIAIKIDFNKIHRWFNIEEELLKHVFYSPIEILFNGQKINCEHNNIDVNPWIDKEAIVELDDIDNENLKSHFDMKDMTEKFKIKITPVNLSKYSPTQKIKAQMILIEFITPIKQDKEESRTFKYCRIRKGLLRDSSIELEAVIQHKKHSEKETIYLNKYPEFKKLEYISKSKIGHNGIFIGEDFTNTITTSILNFSHDNIYSLVHISLSDEHRPSMSISRASDIKFEYKTLSAANLTLSRFITQTNLMNSVLDCSLIYQRFNNNFTIKEILEDDFLNEWKKEGIFLLENNEYKSLTDIESMINGSRKIKIFNYPEMGHLSVDYIGKAHTKEMFVEILSQLFTDGFIDKNGNYIIEKIYNHFKYEDNVEYFPIGFFVRYDEENMSNLQFNQGRKTYGLNIEHIFSRWLRQNAKLLNDKYKGIFEDIKNNFSSWSRDDENNKRLKSLLYLIQKLEPNIIEDKVIASIETAFKN